MGLRRLQDLLNLVPVSDLRVVVRQVRTHEFSGNYYLEPEISWVGANPESTAEVDQPMPVTLRMDGLGPS